MDNHELLKKYRSTSLAFIQAAGEIKPSSLTAAKDGEWSPAYVIHHVADAELQFGVRYANALAEDNPQVIPFDELNSNCYQDFSKILVVLGFEIQGGKLLQL